MKNDIANELFIMNNITVEKLFDLGADAFTLYAFYYKTAKWQKTMEPWANNEYVMKNLGWGRPRLLKTKAQLEKAQMIEQVRIVDEKTNQVQKWAIKLKYLQTIPTSQDGTESTSQFFPPVDGCDCNNIYNNKISKESNNNKPPLVSPKGENEMQHFISLWNKLADVFSEKYPYNKPIARIKSSAEVPNFAVRKKELTKLVKDLLANDEDGSMAESLAKRDNDIWRWAFQQLWIRITKSSFLRGEDKIGENYSEPFRLTPARFMSKKCFIKWVSPNN